MRPPTPFKLSLARFASSLAIPLILTTGSGCQSSSSVKEVSAPPPPAPAARIDSSSSEVSNIAAREVLRRQEALRNADQLAIRAQQLMEEGDYEEALEKYRAAMDQAP